MEMVFKAPSAPEESKGGIEEKGAGGDGEASLDMTFKCDDATQLPFFVKLLSLNKLVETRGSPS